MREIKFRVWDELMNKMWHWREIWDLNWATRFMFALDKGITLMQFTGLFDKNGKEIYEGDIVEFVIQGTLQKPEVVEWNNEESGFTLFFQETDPYYRVELESLEVIGNIYENPKGSRY